MSRYSSLVLTCSSTQVRTCRGVATLCGIAKSPPGNADLCAPSEKMTRTVTLSPILEVPHELLTRIFLASVHDEGNPDDPPRISTILLLCQICSLWRDIALSLPELWSKIRLSVNHGDDSDAVSSLLALCMNRAQECPVNLAISDQGIGHICFFAPLMPHRDHIVKLEIASSDGILRTLFQSPLIPTMLRLKDLTLSIIGGSTTAVPFSLNAYTPQLRQVRLDASFQPFTFSALNLPWSQLSILTLSEVILTPIACDVLRLCQNLEVLSFRSVPDRRGFWGRMAHNLDHQDSAPDVTEIPRLTKLRKLHLIAANADDAGRIFGLMTLPSLTCLSLSYDLPGHHFPQAQFTAFANRSEFKLEDLMCMDVMFTPDELERSMKVIPSLTKLVFLDGFAEHCVTDKLLEVLTAAPHRPPLLPHLEILQHFGIPQFTGKALASMLESRWWSLAESDTRNGVSRLKEIAIDSLDSSDLVLRWDNADVDRIAKCVEEGLSFEEVGYPDEHHRSQARFVAFAHRTGLKLETIRFSNLQSTPAEFEAVLKLLPYLRTLVMRDTSGCIDDGIITKLTVSHENPSPLLPKLEVLHLEESSPQYTGKALIAMVESRWRIVIPTEDGISRLKMLRISSRPLDLDDVDMDRMVKWAKEGMNFEISA